MTTDVVNTIAHAAPRTTMRNGDNMPSFLVRIPAIAALGVALGMTSLAHAQYPERTVRIVVPYAGGGGIDAIGRLLATRLAVVWNKPVVIENRPGAGAVIGTDVVAKAPADGYTFLMHANTLAINAGSGAKLPFNPAEDFAPVVLAGRAPMVLVVGPSAKSATLRDFIAASRTRPGGVNLASAGQGGVLHLGIELLKLRAPMAATHVPYKALEGAVTDVIGGRVDAMFTTPAHVVQQIRTGTLQGLAVSSAARLPQLPEVPTMAEAGVSGFEIYVWFGLFAPAATPAPVINKVAADAREVLGRKDVIDTIAAQGLEAAALGPADFGRMFKGEIATWTNLIRASGIKLD